MCLLISISQWWRVCIETEATVSVEHFQANVGRVCVLMLPASPRLSMLPYYCLYLLWGVSAGPDAGCSAECRVVTSDTALLRSNATHTHSQPQRSSSQLCCQTKILNTNIHFLPAWPTHNHTWLVRGECEKVATEQQQQEDAPAPAAPLPVPGDQQGGLQPPAHQLQEPRQRARDGAGDGQVSCYLEQKRHLIQDRLSLHKSHILFPGQHCPCISWMKRC